MSNKFGVPNSATLLIYDSSNTFQSLSNTCSKNPEYANYCFDPRINSDGDYVQILVHGYKMKFVNDVSFLYFLFMIKL
jgi:hypothetical protein